MLGTRAMISSSHAMGLQHVIILRHASEAHYGEPAENTQGTK